VVLAAGLNHQVGALEHVTAADVGAGRTVVVVGGQGGQARSGLDPYVTASGVRATRRSPGLVSAATVTNMTRTWGMRAAGPPFRRG
jgi:hypothetical protein